ncbi:hypothetical protein F8D52_08625 [Chryseobacterium viscerum]|uniref:Uncharacterized protein n=1 Tax=Chryseobacterium viscerum TaxID=1037377 RepID=A0A5N4BTC7_9FLAO|nr:hypothetical protein F8D52_08625 [Chryseobacterium viscerum]
MDEYKTELTDDSGNYSGWCHRHFLVQKRKTFEDVYFFRFCSNDRIRHYYVFFYGIGVQL